MPNVGVVEVGVLAMQAFEEDMPFAVAIGDDGLKCWENMLELDELRLFSKENGWSSLLLVLVLEAESNIAVN